MWRFSGDVALDKTKHGETVSVYVKGLGQWERKCKHRFSCISS